MTDPPVKRLTTTEVARTLLERGLSASGGESISLNRNAKGVTQIEVVARTQHDETLTQVRDRGIAVYDFLRAAYPYPEAPAES